MPRGYTTARVAGCGAGAAERWAAVLDEHVRRAPEGAWRIGEVLQSYERSAYLRINREALGAFEPLGPPLVLLGGSSFDGPLATRLEPARRGDFDGGELRAGAACGLRAAAGRGFTLAVGATLDVGLGRAALQRRRDPSVDYLDVGEPTARNRAASALEALTGLEDGLGWLDELGAVADGQPPSGELRELAQGWAAVVAEGAEPPVDVLGRGPGATPSGDDVTAGVMLALDRTTTGAQHDRVRTAGRQVGVSAEERTTDVSAALLGQAARGRAADRVTAALAALLGVQEPADLEGAVREAAAVGHTSGVDLVLGVLLVPLTIGPRLAG